MRSLYRFVLYTAAVAAALTPVRATTVGMQFTGENGQIVTDGYGSFYNSPYYAKMTAGSTVDPITIYCDDIFDEVYNGQKWTAVLTPISLTSDYSQTTFGGNTPHNLTDAAIRYQQVAYLVAQFTQANKSQWGSLQETVWSIMDPGDSKLKPSSTWLAAAQANYQTFDASGYFVITDIHAGQNGAVQEFITKTPEAGSLVMIGFGLAAIGLVRLRRQRV